MSKTIVLPDSGFTSYRYFAEPIWVGKSIVWLRCAESGKEHVRRWVHRETWERAVREAQDS